MPHAARRPWSWLIFDVSQKMHPMSAILVQKIILLLLVCGAIIAMSACASRRLDGARIERKAEVYRRGGLARDMVEARRMAEDYYWPESARMREQAARSERDAAMPKK